MIRVLRRRLLAIAAIGLTVAATARTASANATSETFYAKGLVPFRAQQWDEAQRLFDRAVQSDPSDALATYYRGLARARLGYRPAAIEDLRRALDMRPDLSGAILDLGILYFESEEYEQAELWLRRAYEEPQHRFAAALFLGLTLLRRGDPEAARPFLATAGKDPELRASARYYEGIALLRLDEEDAARRALADVAAARPGSQLAQAAEEYLRTPPGEAPAGRPKRWSVYGDLGFEYDSNVVLAPDDGSIQDTRGISDQSDGRAVLGAGGSYRLVDAERVWVAMSYDFSQSLHFSLNEFDLQGHRIRLDIGSKADIVQFGVSGYYDYYLLDFDEYYQQGVGIPWVTLFEGDVAASQLYYRFRSRDFLDDVFDPYRDAYNHAFGIRQLVLLGAVDRVLGFGYQIDDENPISDDGDDFQYFGHQVDAYVRFGVLDWFDALAGYAIRFDLYDERNSRTGTPPRFGKKREDIDHQLTVRVERAITPYLSAAVEYLGVFNDSNVAEFEYNRQIVSAGVRLHF